MNNLAFQIYGTKKATPFQSVWKTDTISTGGSEQAFRAALSVPSDWALGPGGGTNLNTAGYTHNASGSNPLLFGMTMTAGQSWQIICTFSAGSTGEVIINFGNAPSVTVSTNNLSTTINLTTTTNLANFTITPVNFIGNVKLSILQSSSAANQIQLPITVASGKSIWIDWGDNSYSTANSTNYTANRIHTYAAQGEYPVRVFGDDFIFGFGSTNVNDRLKIKSISSWGKLKIQISSFQSCSNLTLSGITDIPDLTGVTNFQYLFGGCVSITSIGRINEWNTSSVTSMNYTFSGCVNFNSNISNWDVSNVVNITSMFNGSAAFNQNISSWNVSKVTNFGSMFQGATTFNNGSASGVANQLPWTINTTATSVLMGNMFYSAIAFNSNLGTGTTPWDVSKVTAFTDMFNGASSFNNGDEVTQSKINDWNVGGSVTSVSISSMFRSASTFNRNIGNWNVSKVTNTSNMFFSAIAFNQPLANWERSTVGNVSTMGNMTNLYAMFQGATAFNQNIGNWNVTKVTQFAQMFQASGFNNGGSTDINNWVINTTPGANILMNGMFVTTGYFNQPLNNWNTSEVINMSGMFSYSLFNNGELPGVSGTLAWNTGKVTNMSSMFSVNSRFNCNIGSWNVSNVTNMNDMFNQALAFNQPLANWERSTVGNVSTTGNVTAFENMFASNTNFNQDISSWNVGKVSTFYRMFYGSGFNNGGNSDTNPITSRTGINGWNIGTNTTSVAMNQMFQSSTFNKYIGDWDVSKVTTMGNMFLANTSFNQDISKWNMSSVTSMDAMFYGTNAFTNGSNTNTNPITGLTGINGWNINTTAASVNMANMFGQNTAFNQPIGSWNVSKVTNMAAMFSNATAFNQPIGNWNVSNVTNFSNFMFGKDTIRFSSTNLDAIYNGWIVNGVKPNITISFGIAKYTALSSAGRALLAAPPNGTGTWTIVDGGIAA